MDNSQRAYGNFISRLGFVRIKWLCEGARATYVSPSSTPSFLEASCKHKPSRSCETSLSFFTRHFYIYYLSSEIHYALCGKYNCSLEKKLRLSEDNSLISIGEGVKSDF